MFSAPVSEKSGLDLRDDYWFESRLLPAIRVFLRRTVRFMCSFFRSCVHRLLGNGSEWIEEENVLFRFSRAKVHPIF